LSPVILDTWTFLFTIKKIGNIIIKRTNVLKIWGYDCMKKVFIEVNAVFSPEGILTPKSFMWEDGVKYQIDKVYDFTKASSLKVGGQGIRFRCRVMGKDVYLFLEDGRWFMEGK
jgi:hypothetical protein